MPTSAIPRALILRAAGINRDADAATAVRLAGGEPIIAHINTLATGELRLADYQLLIIPGGFSYGDHLGAGRLLAVDLQHRLAEQLERFVAAGRPVLGICNGFQVLVKAGLLPGIPGATRQLTLTDNASGQFECRWVQLAADPTSVCVFTRGISRPLEVPVAHGEGRLVTQDDFVVAGLRERGQIALRYVAPGGGPAAYPHNPNGSTDAIAGICNPQGNVLGLMPHPENAVSAFQHPRWTREPLREHGDGAIIFFNAIAYARSL